MDNTNTTGTSNFSFTTVSDFFTLYKAYNPNITTSKQGIVFFNSDDETEDNAYPQKIQDAVRKSSVHSQFVNLKSNLIYASGLFPEVESNSGLTKYISSVINQQGQTLDDLYQLCSYDMSIYEAVCIRVIYNAKKQVAEIYHINPAYIRAEEPDDYGVIHNYYYSQSWGDVTNKKDKKKKVNDIANAIKIPAFNPTNIVTVSKTSTGNTSGDVEQLLYVKRYSANNDVYSIPSYSSALNMIDLESALSEYFLNKIINGYYQSGILYFNANVDKTKQEDIIRDYKRKKQGVKNAGNMSFVFGDTSISKPELVKLSDEMGNAFFSELLTVSKQQIAHAHGASMSLLGIDVGQQLGGNADSNKLNMSRLYFINAVIENYQNLLLKSFNKILNVNGLGEVTVHNEPLKLTVPQTLVDDLTEDERREIVFGLPPKAKVQAETSTGNNTNPNNTI